MKRRQRRSSALKPTLVAIGAVLLCPMMAAAQGNAVLTGTVVDAATRAPLPDVLVTATSPSLQGEQSVLTDSTGTYRVPQLPPGTYTLRFDREQYKPLAREGIELPVGYTLRFNPELIPETAGEATVVVVGKPPVVDVGSTQQGGVISRDFIQSIPVAAPTGLAPNNRSFESVALTVPGARGDTYGVALKGATSPENSYLIDGLSTRNAGFGISGSALSVEFVDSVSVTTGGYLPEFGRTTGGIIGANTRSGGNEFHGSVWGTWTPGALSGAPRSVQLFPGSALSTRSQPHNVVDFGLSLGGFIVKDRLWFFVGVQPEFTRYEILRDLKPFGHNSDGTPNQEDAIYTTSTFADEHQIQYFGKLTYLINDDHRLSLAVTGTPSHSGGEHAYPLSTLQPGAPGGYAFAGNYVVARQFDGNFDAVLKLSSSFAEKRVLLDVTAGWHHEDHNRAPADGSKLGSSDPNAEVNQPQVQWAPRSLTEFEDLPPSVREDCLSDGAGGAIRCPTRYLTGGPGIVQNSGYDSLQVRGVLTLVFQGLGHHLLKLGLDSEVSTYDHTYGHSGAGTLVESEVGGPLFDNYFRNGILTGPDQEVDLAFIHSSSKSVLLGGFVQDSWSILDRVTFNVGVRFDLQNMYGPGGRVALTFPNEWSPRVGAIWDFTEQGKSKLYASYARYYENVPLDLADRGLGREVAVIGAFQPASGDCNPRSTLTASCESRDRLLSGWVVGPNPSWLVLSPGQVAGVDPAVKPPSVDEWVAGVEYEVLPSTRASFAYTHRAIVDWVEDLSANGQSFFIGNPGQGGASTFPTARRVYNSFVVALDKVFADLWLAQLSYTYQNLTGNIEGLYRDQTSQLDPNISSDFDLRRLLVNREGPLPGDIRHTIKAYLAKQFIITAPFSVTTGVAYVGASGAPIDFVAADYAYQNGEVFVFPRGANGRLPWQHSIDLNAALNVRLASATMLTIGVNIFNLFDFQQVTRVSEDYTLYPQTAAPVPNGNPATDKGKIVDQIGGAPITPQQVNPSFLHPVAYQPVRQFRFQARVSF